MSVPRALARLTYTFILATALFSTACKGKPKGSPLVQTGDPRLVELAVEPTADKVLAKEVGELAVRIRVSAAKLPPGERPPLNLALVLDTSGSMEGEAIEAEKQAARDLVARLTAHDRVSLVIFHSAAEVLVPTTPVTDKARKQLAVAIDGITARGTTDMASGLALGLQQAATGRAQSSIDRVVLLGDGVPNDPAPIPGLVAQAVQQHVSITTLGLGIEFDSELLGKIATDTGGRYHYLDKPDEVAAVFEEELLKMRQVVGKNLALNLVAGPGVMLEPMGGFQPMGNGLYAVLGDLTAGEIMDVIVPLKVQGRRDGATVELLDATLTFEDATVGAGQLHRNGFASVHADGDPAAVAASVKTAIELAKDRARANAAILDAISHARMGDLPGAQKILETAIGTTRSALEKSDDPDLRRDLEKLETLRGDLPELAAAALRALQAQQMQYAAGDAGGMPSPAAAEPAPEAVERRARVMQDEAIEALH
jgi:Ca-activated chloride channel family protein